MNLKSLALVTVLGFGTLFSSAQTADSLIRIPGNQNTESDIYYNFNELKSAKPISTWDFAFSTESQGAAIVINESAGVELFLASTDTSSFSNLDTTGLAWNPLKNSETTWSKGAFNDFAENHPQYGWGNYNTGNHHLYASKVFVIKSQTGDFYKIIIDELTAAGEYFFRIGSLDNSTLVSQSFTKSSNSQSNFVGYSISSDVFSAEPISADWALMYTEYITEINQGGGPQPYLVVGFKTNIGVEVAQRDGVATSSDDTSSLTWTSDITEIGWDWKVFNNSTFLYDMVDDRTYFVRTANGVYKLWFTGYVGGSQQATYFNTKQISQTGSSKNIPKQAFTIYPNPANDVIQVNSELKIEAMKIYNLNGQLLQESNSTIMQIQGLEQGAYVLKLYAEGIWSTRLFLKN